MRQSLGQILLALSAVTGGLTVSTPATAGRWKMYGYESLCIGVAGGNMSNGTPIITWNCNGHSDQNWAEQSQPYWGSYVQIWSAGSAAPPSSAAECIALANDGSINPGNKAIIWSCSALTTDQAWEEEFVGWDSSGQPCYNFVNKKALDVSGNKLLLTVSRPPFGDPTGKQLVLEQHDNGLSVDQSFCWY